jgi:predicted nucleic acid-binding protein
VPKETQVDEPILALFDGNVLDWLYKQPAELRTVREALEEGRLRLVSTHILDDEAGASTDPKVLAFKPALAREVEGERLPTRGFVFDISRFDQAALFSEPDADLFDTLSVENPNNAEDALLALTADREGAVLVTEDKDLRKRAKRHGITALDPSDLLQRLQ